MFIPPSTANVERGFSALPLSSTKQRNRLKPENRDRIMRLILIDPDWFDGSFSLISTMPWGNKSPFERITLCVIINVDRFLYVNNRTRYVC